MKKLALILSLTISTAAFAQSGPVPGIASTQPVKAPKTIVGQNSNPYTLDEQLIFDNSVAVLIPSSFVKADDNLIKLNYPDGTNYPKMVLTDNTKKPLLALNMADNIGDRPPVVNFFRDMKNDLRKKYPTIKFIKSDVVRSRTLAIIEFVIPDNSGKNIYNMMAFRYVKDKFFLLNFSCPEADMANWQDTANEIANSVKEHAGTTLDK